MSGHARTGGLNAGPLHNPYVYWPHNLACYLQYILWVTRLLALLQGDGRDRDVDSVQVSPGTARVTPLTGLVYCNIDGIFLIVEPPVF